MRKRRIREKKLTRKRDCRGRSSQSVSHRGNRGGQIEIVASLDVGQRNKGGRETQNQTREWKREIRDGDIKRNEIASNNKKWHTKYDEKENLSISPFPRVGH